MNDWIKPYNLISDNNSANYMVSGLSNIIVELGSVFFYIEDYKEKMIDISKMPFYIRLDWLNYNKKELDLKTINQHIEYHKTTSRWDGNDFIQDDTKISELISIRRDIIIKMTLK